MTDLDLVSRLRDEAARSTMCALAHGNQMRRESDRVNPAAVMREAADALERLQVDTERWISVGERLPKRDENVLVFAEGRVFEGWMDRPRDLEDNSAPIFHDATELVCDEGWHESIVASHWRPLPKPPIDAARSK